MDDDITPADLWKWFWWTVAAVVLITAAIWAIDVGTSGIRGKGNVIKQNNDSNNQIAAQAEFNKLYGAIQADVRNIQSAAKQVAANPADQFELSALDGDQNLCRTDVTTYDGDTQDTTMKDWRPASLPANITIDICEVPK